MMTFENIKNLLLDAIKSQFKSLLALPGQLNIFFGKANNGELAFEVKSDTKKLYAVGQQFIMVVLFLAFAFFYQMRNHNNDLWLYGAILIAALFIRSVWRNRK
jgi:hypothetical protein